ncbi:putative SRP-independent targeting protein 2 [Elsinoe fawcettii]|nr:putative SRP-independent targeting protein 2 [Elsinoe fawcettii]
MAQKAQKTLAAKNAATLNRTHLISLGVHGFFLLVSQLFFTRSRWAWFLVSLPSLIIEFWFERIGRPTYTGDGTAKELKKAGEDLEAKGLTEWMWDVTYWTWINVIVAALAGNWAWYLYIIVPAYSLWLAYTTFSGARQGLAGMGQPSEGTAGQSKRQAKMEKRGGQKMQYR